MVADGSASIDPLIGRMLGDFLVEERIGEGGFAAIYRAEQRALRRDAVIKTLKGQFLDDPLMVERFLHEARTASRLDHPYAAHMYSFGAEPDGLMWIAMELVRGDTLERIVRRDAPLPLDDFLPLFDRICQVVQAVHDLGIVHRDIKPSNVMVNASAGQLLPKLLDFGIAKNLLAAVNVTMLSQPRMPTLDEGELDAGVMSSDRTRPRRSRVALEDANPLTSSGIAPGSPPYMSPEQWRNTDVGTATDVYALGVVAYRMLSGRYPFFAEDEDALAALHIGQPIAPLGGGLSPTLDAVLVRAMAKAPEDRYATPLELGRAFRDAIGEGARREDLPTFDVRLRDAVLVDAPQPIAETLAALDSARRTDQARDAFAQVVRTCVRYVALLALAARGHVEPREDRDSVEITETLRRLRRRKLTDDEWLRLARMLVRPFAKTASAHPLPELVALFFEADGTPSNEDAFAAVTSTERADLAHRYEALAALLRRLGFLSRYRLVVPTSSGAEGWMGLPRPRGALPDVDHEALDTDHPVIVDERGQPLLALWPLLQVAPPIPGALPQVFLLDGAGLHGARFVASPSGYIHEDEGAWSWFSANGFVLDRHAEDVSTEIRPPYLGLATFNTEDSAQFFGRERDTQIAVNRLQTTRFLAIVGPSGAGKSSFVLAGVLPALGDSAAIYARPGARPIQQLVARLRRSDVPCDGLEEELERDPRALLRRLRAHGHGVDRRIVLVVDQFEEIFTACADALERLHYVRALAAIASDPSLAVRVIVTLRDDFLIRAQEIVELRHPLAAGLQLLATPMPADLLRILVEPARRLGYTFEDARLPEEMIESVVEEPGALPLLSFTAQQLWDQRDRGFQQLTRRAYVAMGMVGGALARHAESLLTSMTPVEQALVRDAFRHLVLADGTRSALSREDLLAVLGDGPTASAIVEKLIAARLAVAQEADGGHERIEIIHEALVNAWPRLGSWRREDAEGARLRDQLRVAARQWIDRDRPRGLLWRGEALLELRGWRVRHGARMTPSVREFVVASITEETRGARIRFAAIGIAIVALVVGLGVTTQLYRRSVRAETATRERLAASEEATGRALLLEQHDDRALEAFSRALQLGRDTIALRRMIHAGLAAMQRVEHVVSNDAAQITTVGATASRVFVAGESPFVSAWDPTSGTPSWRARFATQRVLEVAASPDGTSLAVLLEAGEVAIVDVATGTTRGVSSAIGGTVLPTQARRMAWTSGCVAARYRSTVRCIDTTGKPLWTIDRGEEVRRIAGAGSSLWIGLDGGGLESLDCASGAVRAAITGTFERIMALEVVLDGTTLLVADASGRAFVVDAATKRPTQRFADPFVDTARPLRISPSGTLLARARGNDVVVTELASGRVVATLPHARLVSSMIFLGDDRLATGAEDGLVRVWRLDLKRPIAALDTHGNPVSLSGLGGDRVLVWNHGRSAFVWNATAAGDRRDVAVHPPALYIAPVDRGAFVADAAGIAFVDARDGSTRPVWSHAIDDATALGPASFGVVEGTRVARVDTSTNAVTALYAGPTNIDTVVGSDADERLVVRDDKDVATLVDLSTSRPLAVWPSVAVAVLGPGVLALADNAGRIRIADVDGRARCTLEGHATGAMALTFDNDASTLGSVAFDRTARLWDVASCRPIGEPFEHRGPLNALALTTDALVLGDTDGSVLVVDRRSSALLFELELAGSPGVLATSPDGGVVWAGGAATSVTTWDIAPESGTPERISASIAHEIAKLH